MSTLKWLLPTVALGATVLATTWVLSAPEPGATEPSLGKPPGAASDKPVPATPAAQPLPQREPNPFVEAIRGEDFETLVNNLDSGWPIVLDPAEAAPEVLFKACLANRRLGKLCELIRDLPEAEQGRTARQVFDQKLDGAWQELREFRKSSEGRSNNDGLLAVLRLQGKSDAVCAGLFLVYQFCPPAELLQCLEQWEQRNAREGVDLRLEPLFLLNLYVLTLVEKLDVGTIDDVLEQAMLPDVDPLRQRGRVVREEDLEAHGLEGKLHELTWPQIEVVGKTRAEIDGPLSSEQKLTQASYMAGRMKRESVPWFDWDTHSDLSNIMRPVPHAAADAPGVIRVYDVCTTWHFPGRDEDRRPILESLHKRVRAEIADK